LIKLGSVPFLNVRPLIFPLEAALVEHDFEISYFPPSTLSRRLFERKVDLGLIPVFELLQRDYTVVSDISISSYGEVDSVVLLSRLPIKAIKTVAVDSRSQSSASLLKIILEVFNGVFPTYVVREPDSRFLDGVDGGMFIGDTGLKLKYFPPSGYRVFDLGEIWTQETGLPFVYAVYAVNRGVLLGRNLSALKTAKSIGLKSVREIARLEAKKLNLSEDICLTYLTERIRYNLREKEIEGIMVYRELLHKLFKAEDRGSVFRLNTISTYPERET
jgi:chorismate dehydratase